MKKTIERRRARHEKAQRRNRWYEDARKEKPEAAKPRARFAVPVADGPRKTGPA